MQSEVDRKPIFFIVTKRKMLPTGTSVSQNGIYKDVSTMCVKKDDIILFFLTLYPAHLGPLLGIGLSLDATGLQQHVLSY